MQRKNIVITRPKDQAKKLAQALESLGFSMIEFPVIEIVATTAISVEKLKLVLAQSDLVIVTSANAVKFLEQSICEILAQKKCVAIGPATAKALEKIHCINVIVPIQYSSDGILNLDILNEEKKALAILTGENADPLLSNQLTARNHSVQIFYTYKRQLPVVDFEVIEKIKSQSNPFFLTTSLEGLKNLWLLFNDHQDWLCQQSLLVIKSSMQAWALDHHWQGEIILLADPTDEAVVQKLKQNVL